MRKSMYFILYINKWNFIIKIQFFFIILTQIIDEKPNTCLFGQKPLNEGL